MSRLTSDRAHGHVDAQKCKPVFCKMSDGSPLNYIFSDPSLTRGVQMLSHVAPVAAQALYMHPGNGKAITAQSRADGVAYPPSLFVHSELL